MDGTIDVLESTETIPTNTVENNIPTANSSSGVYTDYEHNALSKYKMYRDRVIDDAFRNNTIPSTKELRVINEYIMANEKSIHDTVTNRLKHQENSNKEAIMATVIATLRETSRRAMEVNINEDDEIADEYIPVDIVDGETDINPEPLLPEDFINVSQSDIKEEE